MVRTTLWMSESLASSAGLGCRTTLVQIQPSRLKRKGKPTGDGTRPEPGRATSLEGSTPSPPAERGARGRAAEASVFQTGQAGSTPAGHSAGPPRSAIGGSLTRRRTSWPGRQPEDHPLREGGMLGVQLPPGPLNDALADQPGVVVTLSR